MPVIALNELGKAVEEKRMLKSDKNLEPVGGGGEGGGGGVHHITQNKLNK